MLYKVRKRSTLTTSAAVDVRVTTSVGALLSARGAAPDDRSTLTFGEVLSKRLSPRSQRQAGQSTVALGRVGAAHRRPSRRFDLRGADPAHADTRRAAKE